MIIEQLRDHTIYDTVIDSQSQLFALAGNDKISVKGQGVKVGGGISSIARYTTATTIFMGFHELRRTKIVTDPSYKNTSVQAVQIPSRSQAVQIPDPSSSGSSGSQAVQIHYGSCKSLLHFDEDLIYYDPSYEGYVYSYKDETGKIWRGTPSSRLDLKVSRFGAGSLNTSFSNFLETYYPSTDFSIGENDFEACFHAYISSDETSEAFFACVTYNTWQIGDIIAAINNGFPTNFEIFFRLDIIDNPNLEEANFEPVSLGSSFTLAEKPDWLVVDGWNHFVFYKRGNKVAIGVNGKDRYVHNITLEPSIVFQLPVEEGYYLMLGAVFAV